VKLLPHESEQNGIDLYKSVDYWIKNRVKTNKPPKTYEKVFSKKIFQAANTLKFTIEEIKEEQESDSDEEMIEGNRYSGERKSWIDRGYSLYIPNVRYKKSRQDKELERVIAKDIQSNEIIQEQLGDGWKLLELMKFIFLLKSSNFKAILDSHSNTWLSQKTYQNTNTNLLFGRSKFKSLFVNSKIDSLIRKYLVTKYNSDSLNNKDKVLIELVQHFPMLYEFKTRIIFFKLTAFSESRNKYFASELFTRAQSDNEGGVSCERKRLEVSRDNILKGAYKI